MALADGMIYIARFTDLAYARIYTSLELFYYIRLF
eukprot:UN20984